MNQTEVKKLFQYNSQGLLMPVKHGKFRTLKAGYRLCAIEGVTYYEHRLVFLYHHGYLPDMVDHINGDKADNRVENLRECTPAQNQYNSMRKKNNRSGAKGVVYHPACRSRPWQAKIVVSGAVISLGYYSTVPKAQAAYFAGAKLHAKQFAKIGD